MSRWWRAYDEAVDDPKLGALTDRQHRAWFNLCCITSQNGGKLPPMAAVAFKLRTTPEKAKAIVAELVALMLFDINPETGECAPHNWKGRQFQSDVSTERVQQFRKRKRNVSSAVSETPPDTETETEDRIGDARARGRSQLTEGSKALATAFLQALGIEPKATPPELAGVDWRAVSWESAGWTADMIDAEARRVGPGKPINYYEKCFATAFAKRNQPLPKVEILTPETVVTHAQPNARNGRGNIAQALDRLIESAERGRGIEGDEGSPRLLSNG